MVGASTPVHIGEIKKAYARFVAYWTWTWRVLAVRCCCIPYASLISLNAVEVVSDVCTAIGLTSHVRRIPQATIRPVTLVAMVMLTSWCERCAIIWAVLKIA